jgi:hypothetical protein
MKLVQILLPTHDNNGTPFGREAFAAVSEELTDRFGGLTAYTRAPAKGLWKPDDEQSQTQRDEIVIYEVMAPAIERDWWTAFRTRMEKLFQQESIVVRASDISVL